MTFSKSLQVKKILILVLISYAFNYIELKGQYSGELGIESLKGLDGVAYEIAGMDSNFVNISFLEADVAISLKRAGIKILTYTAMRESDRHPLLFIRNTLIPYKEVNIYFYTLEIDLNQSVLTNGEDPIHVGATTWSSSMKWRVNATPITPSMLKIMGSNTSP